MAQVMDDSEWEKLFRPSAPKAPAKPEKPAKPEYPQDQTVNWTVGSSGDVDVKGITWYNLTTIALGPNEEDIRYRLEFKASIEEDYIFTDADGGQCACWANRLPGPFGVKYTSKNPTIVKVSTY